METILTGKLTESLQEQQTRLMKLAIDAEARCPDDWQEPLRSLDVAWRDCERHVKMSEQTELALKSAMLALQHIAQTDDTAHKFGSLKRTPGESAEFALYELASLGFISKEYVSKLRPRGEA